MEKALKKRDPYWDIVKGLAILCIVIGHCCQGFAVQYVYSFHLPLFMFVCGALFNEEHARDPYRFMGNRLKTLWKPFIAYALSLWLLHNVFTSVGIYGPGTAYSVREYLTNGFSTLLFNQTEQMGGALWFVPLMFITMSGFCFLMAFTRRHFKKYKVVLLLGAVLSAAVGIVLCIKNVALQHLGQEGFIYLVFVIAGFLLMRDKKCGKYLTWYGAVLCVAVYVAFFLLRERRDWLYSPAGKWLFYLPLAFCGIYTMLYLARILMKWKVSRKLFAKMGEMSFSIMALHFLGFKAVMAVYFWIAPGSGGNLWDFPVYYASPDILWPFYIAAGVFLPMLLIGVLRWLRRKNVKDIMSRNEKGETT